MSDRATSAPGDDELAIRNLIHRAALLNDSGVLNDYLDCWTEDMVWERAGAERQDRSAFREAVACRRQDAKSGPGSGGCHLVLNLVVVLDTPTAATADFYMIFLSGTAAALSVQSAYRNRDLLRKTPEAGGLRIDQLARLARDDHDQGGRS